MLGTNGRGCSVASIQADGERHDPMLLLMLLMSVLLLGHVKYARQNRGELKDVQNKGAKMVMADE